MKRTGYTIEGIKGLSKMYGIYKKKALFAFNIWSISSAAAIIDAASQMNQDVILQN